MNYLYFSCISVLIQQFVNFSGVPDDKRQQALQMLGDSSKMTYTISNNGNDWTFGVSTSAGSRDVNFTLGTEIDTTTLDGRPLKV